MGDALAFVVTIRAPIATLHGDEGRRFLVGMQDTWSTRA
jgi:hypothetical protein